MLRAGDWVEIRSEAEILATLDEHGKLDGLQFMPEMLRFCGRRVQVYLRADRTCDTIHGTGGSLRMSNTVHLTDLRCDGAAHGGCQAGCLIFWKEAWLKPVSANGAQDAPSARPRVTASDLRKLTTRPTPALPAEPLYVCQATELPGAATPVPWWDPRPYLRELLTGNVSLWTFVRVLGIAWFNAFQRFRSGTVYPSLSGTLDQTPVRTLNLQPGERVRVRALPEVLSTLGKNRRNRGLSFVTEMVPFCGGEYEVERRVTRVIDEKTGKMIYPKGECIVLEGVICQGHLSRNRLFCARSIPIFWREVWLERSPVKSEANHALASVESLSTPGGAGPSA
jgi:hypothetical protein